MTVIARSAIGVVNGPVPRTASARNPAGLLIASCMAPPATCAIAAGPSLAIMLTAHPSAPCGRKLTCAWRCGQPG